MSYKDEFPAEYHDIPSVILELEAQGIISDASWHNDLCPHFEYGNDDTNTARIELWVSPLNPADREFPEMKRFMVRVDEKAVLITDDANRAANLTRILVAAVKDSIGAEEGQR